MHPEFYVALSEGAHRARPCVADVTDHDLKDKLLQVCEIPVFYQSLVLNLDSFYLFHFSLFTKVYNIPTNSLIEM